MKGRTIRIPKQRILGLIFAAIAISGCRNVGVFEAPGRIEKVGDVYYGYNGESNECYIVQYRLTAEDTLWQDRLHQDFFFANFVSKNASLLWTLETNLVAFARCDGEVEIVKGVMLNPEKPVERDETGKRRPAEYFAAVYSPRSPEKACVFFIPAEGAAEPLATYAYHLGSLDNYGIKAFPDLGSRDEIKNVFSVADWGWACYEDSQVNRCDIADPDTGRPIISILGANTRFLTEEEADEIDQREYAVLKITITKPKSMYSKDGRIKYSSGFKGSFERKAYEKGPNEGPYWLSLDGEYVRAHLPGCAKFGKGRGRHCQPDEGIVFDVCCNHSEKDNKLCRDAYKARIRMKKYFCWRVADGNIIWVIDEDGEKKKARIYGIDALRADNPYSDKAVDRLAELALGKYVYLEERDRGRHYDCLYMVCLDQGGERQDLALQLIKDGAAVFCPATGCYDYEKAEQDAKAAGSGVWHDQTSFDRTKLHCNRIDDPCDPDPIKHNERRIANPIVRFGAQK